MDSLDWKLISQLINAGHIIIIYDAGDGTHNEMAVMKGPEAKAILEIVKGLVHSDAGEQCREIAKEIEQERGAAKSVADALKVAAAVSNRLASRNN